MLAAHFPPWFGFDRQIRILDHCFFLVIFVVFLPCKQGKEAQDLWKSMEMVEVSRTFFSPARKKKKLRKGQEKTIKRAERKTNQQREQRSKEMKFR